MKPLRAVSLLAVALLLTLTTLHAAETARNVPQLVVQLGHVGQVKNTAFAPDGKSFATGGTDGTVHLWDAGSGSLLGAWKAHDKGVSHLAFAPRGGLFASAGYDGKVVLRDTTGKVRLTLNAYGPLGFSPDGSTIVAGIPNPKFPGAYSRPALWNAVTGQQQRAFEINDYDAVSFSPDGKILATATGNFIHIWDTSSSARRLHSLSAVPSYTVTTLAFSADSSVLVSGGETVRFWDVKTGNALRHITANLGQVKLVAYLPNGNLLTVAEDAARLWDGRSFERLRTIKATDEAFGAVALAPDGTTLLCTGGQLRLLNLQTCQTRSLSQRGSLRSEPHNFAFSPDGKTLALTIGRGAGSSDEEPRGEIWVWNAGSIRPARMISDGDDLYHAAPLSGGGKTLFSSMNYALSRYDIASGKMRSFGDWPHGVSMLAVSPDGALAAAAYFTLPLRLFDAQSGKVLRTFTTIKKPDEDQDSWTWIAFSPDSKTLAASSDGGMVRLWSTANGRLIRSWRLPDTIGEFGFTSDGKLLAGAGENGAVWTWPVDGKTPPRALKAHKGDVITLAISPDGKLLASGGEDGAVHLWDVASGKRIRTLLPQGGAIHSVKFSPRGALFCALAGGQAQVWDTTTGKLRLTFRPLPGKANWVAWTPDGFYDAAPGAAPFLRWKQGGKWLKDLPEKRRPDVIARAWGF